MARVFTTSFSYKGRLYTAIASQFDDAVNIYLPDESLHGILSHGKATYRPPQELKIDRPKPSPAQHLWLHILSSIPIPVMEPAKKEETKPQCK